MSHFITGLSVSPQPILDRSPLRNVVAPKFKHVLKDSDSYMRNKHKVNENWKEQLQISKLCKKLTDREFSLLRKQNASQIQHHFTKLKIKLRKDLQPNQRTVQSFFDEQQQQTPLNIKRLLQKMPVKINLASKYNSKLVNLAEQVHNMRIINNEKQNYAKWLDHENNSPIKNPNYCRMSFVLQRLASRNKNGQISLQQEKNDYSIKQLSKINLRKSGDNAVLKYKKNSSYGPKYKRMRTQGGQISLIMR